MSLGLGITLPRKLRQEGNEKFSFSRTLMLAQPSLLFTFVEVWFQTEPWNEERNRTLTWNAHTARLRARLDGSHDWQPEPE